MIKLYKRIKNVLHYHEAWSHDKMITEHWGIVGKKGKSAQHEYDKKLTEARNLKKVLSKPLKDGFEPIDMDFHAMMIVEYPVKGMGTVKDLEKRSKLEDYLNETLGWTGLGHCDGGSMGSGSMEVCCYVVDFKIAKKVIANDLKKTKLADYTRIYDECEDD